MSAALLVLPLKAAVRFDDDASALRGIVGFPARGADNPQEAAQAAPSGDRLGGAGHRAASPTVAASGKRHRGRARGAQQPGRRVAALASALVLTARADDAFVPASVSVPM
jgi:hypothetical protein